VVWCAGFFFKGSRGIAQGFKFLGGAALGNLLDVE